MKLFECIIIIVVAEFGTNDRPKPLTPFDGDINEKNVSNFSACHSPMHRDCDGFAVHANRSMLIYDIRFRWLLNGSVNLLNSLQRQSGLSPHWIWTIEPHTNHLNGEYAEYIIHWQWTFRKRHDTEIWFLVSHCCCCRPKTYFIDDGPTRRR